MRPVAQLFFPRSLFRGDALRAIGLVRNAGELATLQSFDQRECGRFRIAVDADGDRLHETEHLRIDVDLDDLRARRPVLESMLRQGAERTEARAQGEHDVRLRDQLHRGLRALIAERAAPQRVRSRERVVVQVAVGDRRVQQFGQLNRFGETVGHDDAATRQDHRELRAREQGCGFIERGRITRAAADAQRRLDHCVALAVEIIARDVELCRTHLEHRAIEAAASDLRHALRVVHVALVLGDLREDRQLLGFLETTEAHRHRAGLGRDEHDGRVRPVRRSNCGDEVGDARSVLRDAHAVATRGARIAIGHVRRALFVRDGNEADAGGRKDIECVHVRRADDAEDVGDAVGGKRFDQGFGRGHALRGRGRTHGRSPVGGPGRWQRIVCSVRARAASVIAVLAVPAISPDGVCRRSHHLLPLAASRITCYPLPSAASVAARCRSRRRPPCCPRCTRPAPA